jgi:hypothetical protein
MLKANFSGIKSANLDELDATCKRFRSVAYEVGRGAAEQEEASVRCSIGENAKQREKFRHELDFINHDKAPALFERQLRGP